MHSMRLMQSGPQPSPPLHTGLHWQIMMSSSSWFEKEAQENTAEQAQMLVSFYSSVLPLLSGFCPWILSLDFVSPSLTV